MAKKADKVKYSWMQPVCESCAGNITVKIGRVEVGREEEQCCYCNNTTEKGEPVFIQRVNPGAVPYPSILKDED